MASIAFKAKNGILVTNRLVELELAELEGFNFHGVANELTCGLYFDNRVIGGHVVESRQVVGLDFHVIDDVLRHFLSIGDLSVEFSGIGGDDAVKVHVVLGERTGFIKAAKFDNAAHDNLILRDAKYFLLVQSFQGVDDAKGHADWKCRRHSYQDDIDELNDDIGGLFVVDVDDYDGGVGSDCDNEEEEKEFCRLALENVLLLDGEKNYANKLALCSCEVCLDHANWDAELLAVGLEL